MDGILSSGVSSGGFLDEFSADRSCLLVRTLISCSYLVSKIIIIHFPLGLEVSRHY